MQTRLHQHAQLHMDETGWKEAGKRRWWWVVVSTSATLVHVAISRAGKVITTVLGAAFAGRVRSDRLKSYQVRAVARRPIGWGHRRRKLLAADARDGPLGGWAADRLAQIDSRFARWHCFRDGPIDRATLVLSLQPVHITGRAILERGRRRYDQAAGLRAELLARGPALGLFVTAEGVEPTNNAAERAVRPAVLWRKGCFGAQRAAGNPFVERILPVSATGQQQNRQLRTFLTDAVSAYWAGQPAPTLLTPP